MDRLGERQAPLDLKVGHALLYILYTPSCGLLANRVYYKAVYVMLSCETIQFEIGHSSTRQYHLSTELSVSDIRPRRHALFLFVTFDTFLG